jgi:acetyl-CoA carboxylase carboxyl transferase subunit alpha
MAARMKDYLVRTLAKLLGQPADELIQERYEKFRRMGVFLDPPLEPELETSSS